MIINVLIQIRCFDAPLQPQALQDVKSIVYRNLPHGVNSSGLTMEGMCAPVSIACCQSTVMVFDGWSMQVSYFSINCLSKEAATRLLGRF